MKCQECRTKMDKGVLENSSWAKLSDKGEKLYSPQAHTIGKNMVGKFGLIKEWLLMIKPGSAEFAYAYRCPRCRKVVLYSEK